jgi:hypothetical protein
MMMEREKKDIKPLLLKFGVALALSFAGFLYSRFRTKRIKSSPPPPSPRSLDHGSEVNLNGGRARHKDGLHAITTTSNSCNIVSVAAIHEETYIPKVSVDSIVGFSPSSKSSGEKEGLLLPEFNDLVKELDFSVAHAGFSPEVDIETPRSNIETSRSAENDEYEQEIRHLRNMVRMLRDKERNLEVQLLEYYGLKEQETAVMELQNRLKINNMEAKLFSLKIESLQADNQRLEAQAAEHVKVVAELEAARAKIKLLKKKLRYEAEQNKEQILALQQRVLKLQDHEYRDAPSDPNIQLKLQRLKDLEVEAEELRKSNLRLQKESTELSRRLESTQILANSVLEDPEAEALRVESEHLRRKNEDLEKEIEQLQAYRCSDAEELVYLKWLNACLRYEVRNCQLPDGKAAAKDLSKTLSPKSEEKAKQLIIEYANTEGMGEKVINIMDSDYDQWSSSQASVLTDSGEFDYSSADNSSAIKTNRSSKAKYFRKLRRLLHGKDSHDNQVLSAEKSRSLEDADSPRYSSGTEGHSNKFTSPQGSSGLSLDLNRFKSIKEENIKDIDSFRRNSDMGSSYPYKRFADSALKSTRDRDSDANEKYELKKYADVLKESQGGKRSIRSRPASFSSV